MKHLVLVWLALAILPSCAAHNSHRVTLRPHEELAPLVDEAVTSMEAVFGRPFPSDRIALRATVEPVVVRWVLPPEPTDPTAPVSERTDLQPLLLEALRQRVPEGDPALVEADYVVSVQLELDLHHPDGLGLRVACDLLQPAVHQSVAEGKSGCFRIARLYCHGCRDTWRGLGTSLGDSYSGEGDYSGGYYPVYVPICNPSSPGYIKH